MGDTKTSTIHLIGHGHIDPTWLWRWTEGYEEVRATFRSAVDRLDTYPDICFTATSPCFYEWIAASEPKLFERIRHYVQEGRWELAGGMWIEPDCNIPCGEALVRQGLFGQRSFERLFGRRAVAGFNPDSFGHNGMLPQILTKLGLNFYAFMRPMPGIERDYPEGTVFDWKSPDGAAIFTCNLLDSYNADLDIIARCRTLPHSPHIRAGQEHILAFFGVGNHGGGPTIAAIEAIKAAQQDTEAPALRFATLQRYFEASMAEYPADSRPVVASELQHHARGCYSVVHAIKRLNRSTEHALMTAEHFATAAWLLKCQSYPKATLNQGWKDLLYNQFHDIIAGTSIPASYDDARDQMGAARNAAHTVINSALQSIARDVDTQAEGNTIMVVNSHAWPVRQPVLVAPIVGRCLEAPLHLVDDCAQPQPVQAVMGEVVAGKKYVFVADVPAMGYRCYHMRSGSRPIRHTQPLDVSPTHLENQWWRMEFDVHSGAISRLYDKMSKCDVLKNGATLHVLTDSSDTWSHGVQAYQTEVGRFGKAALAVAESGDVLAGVRASSRFRQSEAVLDFTIYRNKPAIDIQLRVNWQEPHHVLKLGFDTCLQDCAAIYETAYGHTVRACDGQEQPGKQWVDLAGRLDQKAYGVALLNDSVYSFDALDSRLRATLLRSPAYAHHDPDPLDAGKPWPITDIGIHQYQFRLVPHAGDWEAGRVAKQAWELNVPLIAHVESAHPGKRPAQASLLGTESENVLLNVIKQSEDGEDLLIRGFELKGIATTTMVHLPFFEKSFRLEFQPFEIKTVRIKVPDWTMEETNFLEETI